MEVCLGVSADQESSFHHCGSPVNIVQASLCAENTLQRRPGSAVKHVQACLSVSKDRESSFHCCVSTVKLVQSSLLPGNTLQRI